MMDKFYKIILLGLCALGIWVRAPQLLSYPRFWAEEGARYFQSALEHGFWYALVFLDPQAGYLDVTRNLSAGLASLVPLEYAPYVTTYIAFSVQLLACFIIIYGHSEVFDNYWRKIIGCLIVLFATAVIDEVWLNTINSMTWYGLIGFLIALERLSLVSRPLVIFYRSILTVGALSGPYVCMLLPVYGLVAVRDRTRDAVINAAIVASAFVVHSLVLLYFLSSNFLNQKRFHGLDYFDAIDSMFWNHAVRPIFGYDLYPLRRLFDSVAIVSDTQIGLVIVLTVAFLASIGIVLYVYINDRAIFLKNWQIAASWVCISVGTVLTSFEHQLYGRYTVLPGWLILFILLDCSRLVKLRILASISIVLLIIALGRGAMNYSLAKRTLCDGHSWATDIGAGLGATPKVIAICPKGWSMVLPPLQVEQ